MVEVVVRLNHGEECEPLVKNDWWRDRPWLPTGVDHDVPRHGPTSHSAHQRDALKMFYFKTLINHDLNKEIYSPVVYKYYVPASRYGLLNEAWMNVNEVILVQKFLQVLIPLRLLHTARLVIRCIAYYLSWREICNHVLHVWMLHISNKSQVEVGCVTCYLHKLEHAYSRRKDWPHWRKRRPKTNGKGQRQMMQGTMYILTLG